VFKKNSHCSYCGHALHNSEPWPKHCANCGNVTFLNPIPVTVVLVPVDEGLIVIRRGIEPRRGMLALPGGYINLGETWQEAAPREVFEETGVALQTNEIREFGVRSAMDGTLLVFGLAQAKSLSSIPRFTPTDESAERLILTEPQDLAFDLHMEMVEIFFHTKAKDKNWEPPGP
jgi:ADP-ribose pyrophosphatase YjhB (NUDIX family)